MLAQDIVDHRGMRLRPGERRVKGGNTQIRKSYGRGSDNDHFIVKVLRRGCSCVPFDDVGDRVAWKSVVTTVRGHLARGKLGRAKVVDDHATIAINRNVQALAPRCEPYLDCPICIDEHSRVGIAVPALQITLEDANAERCEKIGLLPRARRVPSIFGGYLHTPTVLRNEWIVPNDPILCIGPTVEKAIPPDGLRQYRQ